jgi:hypothetical protein
VRKSHQPFELSNLEKYCEINSPHKVSADADISPANPNKPSDTERDYKKSLSLKRAMAEVDRLFPEVPVGNSSLQTDNAVVHQCSLEEELVSSIHPDASSLFMPDLRDEVKLEVAATTVDDECSNLIVACYSPGEDDFDAVDAVDALADVSGSKVSVMSLGKGTERIGGILAERKNQVNAKSPKSKIVLASLILPVISIGIYAYLYPQNALQLALLPKIELHVMQQISAVDDFLFRNKKITINNSAMTSQSRQTQPIKITKLSGIPVRSSTYGLHRSNVESAKDTKLANVHPEPVISVDTHKQNVRQTSAVLKDILPTSSQEFSVLSQRFDQKASPDTKHKIVRIIPDQDVPQSNKIVPVVTPQLKQKPARKLSFAPVRRDFLSVQRVVHLANVGEVLDGAQLKTFINGLVEGECVSAALHGVFGENKISPVFVSGLMKNMDRRC